MFKDQKDEMIVMLKRQIGDLEEQKRGLSKKCEELKRDDSAAEVKIKALSEMHASKIKTLLKSIQNLKVEVQKEKFDKKDNVRAKKIESLMKEHEDFEMALNALRRVVNDEDKCDQAIKQELQKGPKRVRVASREELKMEIKKYKNMALRLLEILKQNGIKQPAGFKIEQTAGTGFKEDRGENAIYDINEMSQRGGSQLGGTEFDNKENNTGEEFSGGRGTAQENAELNEAKERLEDQVVRMNLELREKNERLLELLEEMEDVRIQVYARDKSVSL